MIKGHHGFDPLGWHTTFVENHVDAFLTPLGVMVDYVPLESIGQELCSGLVGSMLLIPRRGGSMLIMSSPFVLVPAFFGAEAVALVFLVAAV